MIARRLGPFPQIVETAGGGELFSTTEELVAAMRRLQQDPARRDRLAEAGSAAFLRRWSESAVVPQFLDIVARSARTKGDARVLGKLGQSDRASGHPPLPAGATARG